MKRIVLIDADINIYQISAQNQIEANFDGVIIMASNLDNSKHVLDETIKGIVKKVDADDYLLCISGDSNFRKKHFPSYKLSRKETRKPMGYQELKKHAMDNHPYKLYDELEADDVIGIMSTMTAKAGVEYVIHSDDKDLKTIPATIWDRKEGKLVKISELEAARFLYGQILTGDVTDGYKGCPTVGKTKAQRALSVCTSELEMREAAYKLYCKFYKDDEIAKQEMIAQSGQARILRASDFDFKTKSVILWHPWRNDGNIQVGT